MVVYISPYMPHYTQLSHIQPVKEKTKHTHATTGIRLRSPIRLLTSRLVVNQKQCSSDTIGSVQVWHSPSQWL